MRSIVLSILFVVACADEGAHLTLTAPTGPVRATAFQVVLASPDLIPTIAGQRVSPNAMSVETVTYYLQRTAAGAMGSIDNVDGFTILVEPSATIADTALIPFVLLYDDAQRLVGVGTYQADAQSPQPAPIFVRRGEVDKYTIVVEPVAEVVDTAPVVVGEAMQVTCVRDDGTMFQSGVVWRPQVGGELRLLLPSDPASDDATQRTLDLDCDGHEVAADPSGSSADCDDTRARFHAGAKEQCDMEDWNCDGIPYALIPCVGSAVCPGVTTPAFQLCDDTSGQLGTCTDNAVCACAANGSTCTKCIMTFAHGANSAEVAPCQPGVGVLTTQGACESTTCTVAVIAVRNGWDVTVAPTSLGPFALSTTGITATFEIRAKRPEGPGFSMIGVANGSVGTADIVVVPANGNPPKLISVDLELSSSLGACTGTGPFQMNCSP